jgi:glycosyltransferase involved in cell wall biosynthesis
VPFTFGYIGGYLPYKGVELVLEAFLELRRQGHDVRLRLLGVARDHDYIQRLKERAQTESDIIYWGGEFAPEELPEILSQMDALVIPSLCEETYSFAAREALVCGLPVIGANAGALPEALAEGENNRLFERGNLHALMQAMNSYL